MNLYEFVAEVVAQPKTRRAFGTVITKAPASGDKCELCKKPGTTYYVSRRDSSGSVTNKFCGGCAQQWYPNEFKNKVDTKVPDFGG